MYIDVNCSIGNWPPRPLPLRTPEELAAHLERESVTAACVSSVEAALLDDPTEENMKLLDAASGLSPVLPVPVINPRHRRWEQAFQRYVESDGVRAVKVHLNYQHVDIEAPEFGAVIDAATESGLAVLVPLRIEDERLSHIRLQAPPVSMAGLIELAGSRLDTTFICLNAYRNELIADRLPGNLYADIAFVERFRTLESLAEAPGLDRIVFGSNTPFFVTRAASMKVAWADVDETVGRAVSHGTAAGLLGLP